MALDKKLLKEHLVILEKWEGKRPPLFDSTQMSKGWVITTAVPKGFWDKCNKFVAPLRPDANYSSEALKQYKQCRKLYGKDIVFLIQRDDNSPVGFSGGFIILEDLDKDPYDLLGIAYEYYNKNDPAIARAKRVAAMIVGGWSRTRKTFK